MSEPVLDDKFQLCKTLLDGRGYAVMYDALTVIATYEDQKILVEGVLDRTNTKIERMAVFINLPYEQNENPPQIEANVFRLQSPEKSKYSTWTQVYFWKEYSVFWRQGAWMQYIADLNKARQDDHFKAMAFNRKPVDDADLFKK